MQKPPLHVKKYGNLDELMAGAWKYGSMKKWEWGYISIILLLLLPIHQVRCKIISIAVDRFVVFYLIAHSV